MSLKDSWLAGKHDRQQELEQRQRAVQERLLDYNQARQQMSAELRQNLAWFRQELSQQDDDRRSEFQLFQAQLQAFYDQLQADVRSLRANLQVDRSMLKADTQTYLTSCQRQRLQARAETQQQLADFMETLQTDVQTYLTELALLRHQRADQLQQDLQHSRATRKAEIDALFAKLAAYRQSLTESVWGQSKPTPSSSATPTRAKLSAIPPAITIATQPTNGARVKSTIASKPPSPKGLSSSNGKTALIKSAPSPNVTKTTTAPIPTPATEVTFEKEVYTFLHEQQGARLTQIESALQLNRFQTVDALRSLIQKGLITQTDRVYSPTSPA